MNCYSCDSAAINVCKRCSRPYCDDHGNAAYCADCLSPASALPSFNLYRGALLALLAGTAIAVVMIIRPPGETKGAAPVIAGKLSPTATASGGTPQPSVAAETPQPSASPETPQAVTTGEAAQTGTPASATSTPAVTPTVGFGVYVVQEGDSVASIAQDQLPPGDNLSAYENAIIALNNLTGPDPVLHPGQKLLLPPHS